MNISDIHSAKEWFSVLQTSLKTQTAVMTLAPGRSSGGDPEAHQGSEQVLLVLEGAVLAEVEGESRELKKGEVVLIPAGVRHKFTNLGQVPALTFNTYSPPEY